MSKHRQATPVADALAAGLELVVVAGLAALVAALVAAGGMIFLARAIGAI